MKLKVFSPAFYGESKPPIQRLEHSCKVNDIELVPYGLGQVYEPHGIKSHIVELANTLESTAHADVDIALMTDAFDSWIVSGTEEILSKFYSLDTDILIAGERDCWPVRSLREFFPVPESGSPYRWLNAGGLIGYRDKLIPMLRKLTEVYRGGPGEMEGNPQGVWSCAYVDEIGPRLGIRVKIDTECAVFQTMSGGGFGDLKFLKVFDPKRVLNLQTGRWPSVIHHNGRCGDNSAVEKSYRLFYPDGESVSDDLRR